MSWGSARRDCEVLGRGDGNAPGSGGCLELESVGPCLRRVGAAIEPAHDLVDLVERATGIRVADATIDRSPEVSVRAAAIGAAAFTERAKGFALQRGGEPHEIVGAALYLAGDASSFTTGSILKVDGGLAHASS